MYKVEPIHPILQGYSDWKMLYMMDLEECGPNSKYFINGL